MAWCLLELARPTFPRIGSLLEVDGSVQVAGRPLTLNNGQHDAARQHPAVRSARRGRDLRDGRRVVRGAGRYARGPARLSAQRPRFVADDCRNKYVSRQLFRQLARQGRLSTFGFVDDDWSAHGRTTRPKCLAPDGSGLFRMYCDDYRPSNVLVGPDDDIAAVIDWEYAYAAPTQFALDPPWWLLFERPEIWEPSIGEWSTAYEPQIADVARRGRGAGKRGPRSSAACRCRCACARAGRRAASGSTTRPSGAGLSTLSSGRIWTSASSASGTGTSPDDELWKTRLHLLDEKERGAMEPFVPRKMEEARERALVWDPAEARQRLADLLFD